MRSVSSRVSGRNGAHRKDPEMCDTCAPRSTEHSAKSIGSVLLAALPMPSCLARMSGPGRTKDCVQNANLGAAQLCTALEQREKVLLRLPIPPTRHAAARLRGALLCSRSIAVCGCACARSWSSKRCHGALRPRKHRTKEHAAESQGCSLLPCAATIMPLEAPLQGPRLTVPASRYSMRSHLSANLAPAMRSQGEDEPGAGAHVVQHPQHDAREVNDASVSINPAGITRRYHVPHRGTEDAVGREQADGILKAGIGRHIHH